MNKDVAMQSVRRRGFSLVELLTVIGIFGILATLILLGVSGVRERAGTVKCGSNLRQIYIALKLYSQEHNNEILPGYQADPKYPGEHNVFSVNLQRYMNTRNAESMIHCPADVKFDDGTINNHGSYQMSTFASYDWMKQQRNRFDDFERYRNPEISVFIYDAFASGHGAGQEQVSFRHGERANILFLDGSVRLMGREEVPEGRTEGIWQGRP